MSPQEHKVERRLAAIFAADVAGYARLMDADEVGTLRALEAHREIMDRLIAEAGGRIANTAGDSVLAEFPSAVDAVGCAMEVQERLAAETSGFELRFRIGVHVGDVMVRGRDLFGDGVNIAARLQAMAEPGGVCISGAAHDCVRKTSSARFADLGPQRVKNIPEPVRAYAMKAALPAAAGAEGIRPLPVPDKPSIAVLPFANMSGDPEQDYFADGIVEEVTAALSRVRSFFVIARNSAFTYKGKAVDVRQVGRELGVRYVLEGSVRKAGDRVRIAAQLVDAGDGSHIWAERYDGALADIFDLQDRVTEGIVGAMEPTIALSEIERARRKRPESLDAYDCVMRALPAVWAQDAAAAAEGLRLVERAIALDEAYALPKALAAWCYAQRVTYMRSPEPSEDRAKAVGLAEQAAALDSNEPLVLTVLAGAYSLVGRLERALTVIEKALTLDPNSAWGWTRSGFIHVFAGRPDTALAHFQRAQRLSPLDPMRYNTLVGIGAVYFSKAQYEEAARFIEQALREKPTAAWAYRILAATYAHAGRPEDARRAVSKLLDAFPGLTLARAIEATPGTGESLARYARGLREAGLPD